MDGRGGGIFLFPFFFLEIDFQDLHWSKTKKGECRMSVSEREIDCLFVCVSEEKCVWVCVRHAGDCLNKVCKCFEWEGKCSVCVWSCDRLRFVKNHYVYMQLRLNPRLWTSGLRARLWENQLGCSRGWQEIWNKNKTVLFTVRSCM